MTDKDLANYLPIGVQKSYFLLPKSEREILNTALEQYHPGQRDPILVGGSGILKSALRLMSVYRLKIEEIDSDLEKGCKVHFLERRRMPEYR